jgi:hypothetical protein
MLLPLAHHNVARFISGHLLHLPSNQAFFASSASKLRIRCKTCDALNNPSTDEKKTRR